MYGTANAQLSLSDAPTKQATPLLMAVGPKGGANWDVLSAIAAQVDESAGFTLLPVETTGSQLSARAVCKGVLVTYNGAPTQIAAAIVGRDAATYIAHEFSDEIPAGCAGHYAVLSKGLFPYYLYAIVRADNPHSELSKLIDDAPATKPVRIAAGDAGISCARAPRVLTISRIARTPLRVGDGATIFVFDIELSYGGG